ncbi:Ras-related protein ced-10 [Orchesella cincta]|uniref:Ras-related protein ced-10 n=1 Tax=Orchesella cincta TaxID=48709 RepID=A0A1D2M6A1_ORCCI|nr:Ras-related protein ced-10 [Orchesella cincta]
MESIKCVVVGDRVGKTSMLIKYTTQVFPTETVPTVFDQFTVNLSVDDKPVTLNLCDSSGSECYDRLRPMIYPRTDVCIICFSLEEQSASFENVQKKWWPEVNNYLPTTTTPIILVGTKQDVRDVQLLPEKIYESQVKGQKLAKDINAVKYMECSALEDIGLAEIFQKCIRVVRQPPSPHVRTKGNSEVLLPNYLRRFYSCCRLI